MEVDFVTGDVVGLTHSVKCGAPLMLMYDLGAWFLCSRLLCLQVLSRTRLSSVARP